MVRCGWYYCSSGELFTVEQGEEKRDLINCDFGLTWLKQTNNTCIKVGLRVRVMYLPTFLILSRYIKPYSL